MTELTLKEIRQRYQNPHYNTKKIDYWLARGIYSKLATPIVRFLFKTPVTANQVTILWVLLGLFSCFLFTFGKYWISILACVLIQIHILLDYVDGPIARFRNSSDEASQRGLYIERIGHDLIYTAYFYCIGLGAIKKGLEPRFILTLSFLASLGYFFYKYTRRAKIYCTLVYNANKGFTHKDTVRSVKSVSRYKSLLRRLYRRTQYIWDPITFTFISLVASLFDLLYILPIFYGLTYPVQFIASYVYQAKIPADWVYDWLKSSS